MNFKQVYIFWTFFATFTFGLSPPQNVTINIKDNIVTFTWTLPSESITWTHLEIYDGRISRGVVTKNVRNPKTSFTTVLHPCLQYTVKLQTVNASQSSKFVDIAFWMTEHVFTSDIKTNVNLTWTTSLDDFYTVKAPSGDIIYMVIGGYIIDNSNSIKYHYKVNSRDSDTIHITVNNIQPTDSGLYTTVYDSNNKVDGCCLLVITDKPTKPILSYDKHPFVGFPTQFTCRSEVRRWPNNQTSSLSYSFSAIDMIGKQTNNMLTINVTKSDKGKRVYCQATDDKLKKSDSSYSITVDPYYGPFNVSISPTASQFNVTEGDKLQPITCSADCNPNCIYVWSFTNKKYTDGNILEIENVQKKDNGSYRCRVKHPYYTLRPEYPNGISRQSKIDVAVNVLYPPELRTTSFSKGPNSFTFNRQNYQFNEGDHIYVRIYIDSNPKPQLYLQSNSFPKKNLKYNVSSSYYTAELPSLECEDSGLYTIKANNGIKNSAQRNVNLTIYCEPKKIQPEREIVGTKIGALENVTINIVANPKPNVQWIYYTGYPWKTEKTSTGFNYKLTSAVKVEDDSAFGRYGVRIFNTAGSRDLYIKLVPKATTTTSLAVGERKDVRCDADSMSIFIPTSLLSQNESLTWRDPHCKPTDNRTHYVSRISLTDCGTTVKFTTDEVIFENDLFIHNNVMSQISSNDTIDFGSTGSDIIPVQCVYPRTENITLSYRPAQTHIRFYEKRYGHMNLDFEQYKSEKFVNVMQGMSTPMAVPINKDMFIRLHGMHINSTDIAIKVDSCVATPSIMPAYGNMYQLIDQGCPASPAVKLYPSTYDEFKFSVKTFEFKSSPGSVVYIHCQVSICSASNPQCITGCRIRHRRDVDDAEHSSHLVSGGPYIIVADEGSIQMSTIVAGVCAFLAVVATVVAVIGWRKRATTTATPTL